MSQATDELVDSFCKALKSKLNAAEQKHGFNDDWKKDDWETQCQQELLNQVRKGDPLDVAAYAAFCWARGWTTSNESHNG